MHLTSAPKALNPARSAAPKWPFQNRKSQPIQSGAAGGGLTWASSGGRDPSCRRGNLRGTRESHVRSFKIAWDG
jgi:hypothetical protein